jgi:uncharacterized protein YegL
MRKTLGSYVLLMDISNSMSGRKTEQLRQAARIFIESLSFGSDIAMVLFNYDVKIIQGSIIIRTAGQRLMLLNKIPKNGDQSGATSIGNALRTGVRLLPGVMFTTVNSFDGIGGHIVLITDGVETADPEITDMEYMLTVSKVRTHSIIIGDVVPEEISHLASITSGNVVFYDDYIKVGRSII